MRFGFKQNPLSIRNLPSIYLNVIENLKYLRIFLGWLNDKPTEQSHHANIAQMNKPNYRPIHSLKWRSKKSNSMNDLPWDFIMSKSSFCQMIEVNLDRQVI